ncbi:PLASTID MOVEMENT IMPAIRED PROTEIN-RELATED [Salix purpurea]|uniref:PLASTID MOVEMENT IMPAIRED PROTEIN-RELATED n=1 Tax=Salix purpurea TaxID=77065 RepID=A0A9Q0VXX4_SALPP|nr:PLASTID MOVEMENT IMPAIRED PROTEIN-RELATED [Salix purpurea]
MTCRKALEAGEQLPPLLGINTGHGKHKYSEKGLANVFESHLKELNAPFHEAPDKVGWFLTTKVAAESWVVASFDSILYNGYQSVSWVDYKQRVAKSTAMTTERGEKLSSIMEEKGSFKPQQRLRKITSGHYRVYMLVHSALSHAPLPPSTRLEPGEVYYLMPPHDQPFKLEVPLKLTRQGACARRKMKIVVTRQQLGLILRNSKQFQLKGIAAGFSESFKVGDRKWQPSLVTILKVQKFEKVGIFQLLIHWLRYREYRCVQAWKGQTNIEDDAG